LQKLTESGYGDEVYKLAVLSGVQRDNLIDQLKPMPGHKAKLSAFFTVIDEVSKILKFKTLDLPEINGD
jgi:hypothetical protein